MRALPMGLVMLIGCWTGSSPPPPMAPICRTCATAPAPVAAEALIVAPPPVVVAAPPPVVVPVPPPPPPPPPPRATPIVTDAVPVVAIRPANGAELPAAPAVVTAPLGVSAVPPEPVDAEDRSGARFSGGRLIAEIIGGVLVGGGLGVAVYEGAGEGVAGVFAGSMVSIAVAPLVEYGVGRLLGGRGSLKMTYIGGFLAFGISTPTAPGGEVLVFVVGEALLPIMSGLFFELNSNTQAQQFQRAHAVTVGLMPRVDRGAVDGAMLGAALRW